MTDREKLIATYAVYLRQGTANTPYVTFKTIRDYGGDLAVTEFLVDCAEQLYLYIDAPRYDDIEWPGVYEYEVVEALGHMISSDPDPSIDRFKELMAKETEKWFCAEGRPCPFTLNAPPADVDEVSANHAWEAVNKSLQIQVDLLERAMRHSLDQVERHRRS